MPFENYSEMVQVTIYALALVGWYTLGRLALLVRKSVIIYSTLDDYDPGGFDLVINFLLVLMKAVLGGFLWIITMWAILTQRVGFWRLLVYGLYTKRRFEELKKNMASELRMRQAAELADMVGDNSPFDADAPAR